MSTGKDRYNNPLITCHLYSTSACGLAQCPPTTLNNSTALINSPLHPSYITKPPLLLYAPTRSNSTKFINNVLNKMCLTSTITDRDFNKVGDTLFVWEVQYIILPIVLIVKTFFKTTIGSTIFFLYTLLTEHKQKICLLSNTLRFSLRLRKYT